MGLIQSIICTATMCVERVLMFSIGALFLLFVMLTLVVMMVYGITVGYHYAQKELAAFAEESKKTTAAPEKFRRGGDSRRVVRLLAVNKTKEGRGPQPAIDFRTGKPKEPIFLEPTATPMVLLETERPSQQPELSPNEKEIAKKIIGRFRRSKNFQLFSSIKNETNQFRFPIPSLDTFELG